MFDAIFKYSYFHWVDLPLREEIQKDMSNWLEPAQHNYAPKRKQEYLGGRWCAIQAAKKAGVELKELPMAKDRSPLWPKGIVGSITHTHGIAMAAVSNKVRAIGIDAEKLIDEARFERIQKLIASKSEIDCFKHLAFSPTLIFSAKESLYKALHPECKEYFGFLEATMMDIGKDSFTIKLHSEKEKVSNLNGSYTGRYYLFNDIIVSTLELT
ncbi:MAG: phosphopantetheinyl transferase [Halobacteriovoraceae bacterium]|nr:phosphopantetheinyl transferase [Halobacteriovoraceae bacterium]|tara:strand:+ start:296404 stop:297039 length:636 start_codon:yes stop_codon:yes gene_type:complete